MNSKLFYSLLILNILICENIIAQNKIDNQINNSVKDPVKVDSDSRFHDSTLTKIADGDFIIYKENWDTAYEELCNLYPTILKSIRVSANFISIPKKGNAIFFSGKIVTLKGIIKKSAPGDIIMVYDLSSIDDKGNIKKIKDKFTITIK